MLKVPLGEIKWNLIFGLQTYPHTKHTRAHPHSRTCDRERNLFEAPLEISNEILCFVSRREKKTIDNLVLYVRFPSKL